TTDSGPRHFAAAFQTPVITLFGPTHIAWTRTYHPQALHLFHPVDCGPCQRPVCPEGHHRCMRELTPDQVYQAALRMLFRSHRVDGPELWGLFSTDVGSEARLSSAGTEGGE